MGKFTSVGMWLVILLHHEVIWASPSHLARKVVGWGQGRGKSPSSSWVLFYFFFYFK